MVIPHGLHPRENSLHEHTGNGYGIIFCGVNNSSRLSGIYQFSQHAQPCVPFLLIPPLPPQDNNKNDSINPQVMAHYACHPNKSVPV